MFDHRLVAKALVVGLGILAGAICAPNAQADDIDLNDFFTDPAAAVSIAADGSSATLIEDASVFSVLLSNDPGLGDPHVIFGGADTFLRFDYAFTEGAGEDDEFAVFLIDADTGSFVGAPFEFFADETGAGTITWDLSTFGGTTLGLQFELNSLFGDSGIGSTLIISNVETFVEGADPVPEPGTMLLVGSAGAAMWFARRRRQRQAHALRE
jgi:hypothetical protein